MAVGVIGSDIIKSHGSGPPPVGPTLTTISTLTATTDSPDGALAGYDQGYNILFAELWAASDHGGTMTSFRIESDPYSSLFVDGNPVVPGTTIFAAGSELSWISPNSTGTVTAFTVKGWDGTNASATAVNVRVTLVAQSMGFTFHTTAGQHTLQFTSFTGAASVPWQWQAGGAYEKVDVPNHSTYTATIADRVVTRWGDPTGPTVWSVNKNIKNITLLPLSLTSITIAGTTTLGLVDLTGLSALTSFTANNVGIAGLTLTGCSALVHLYAESTLVATGVDISPCPLLNVVDFLGAT